MSVEKHYISWEDFHADVLKLSAKISKIIQQDDIKGIVTIARGALVPSAIISHEFNIRKIEVLSLKSYDSKNKSAAVKIMSLPYEALRDKGDGWIIIDELVDTGNTLNYIENIMPEALFFSVYLKELSFSFLKGYVKAFKKGTWLVFPWEIEVKE